MIFKLALRRLGLGIVTVLVVSVLIFSVTELLPGDVATAILGQGATPEAVAEIHRELDLDHPAYVRYGRWLKGFVEGDFGRSLTTQEPVSVQLVPRLLDTLALAGLAALLAVPLAIGLGLVAAIFEGRALDRIISTLSLATISVPEFFMGYLLIILLATKLQLFPSLALVQDGMGFWDRIYAMAMPALTLTFVTMAHMMRMTRAAVIDVLQRPYIEMARLKGIKPWRVVIQHALPNALGPIVTVVALNLAYLVVGVVVVEVVFVYPGMGQYLVDAVTKRDMPVVQACVLIFALVYVLLNLLADIAAILANPRLRHPR
jgi:peptide/nickel transport system permease protein